MEKRLRRVKRMELEKENIHQQGVFEVVKMVDQGDKEKVKGQ